MTLKMNKIILIFIGLVSITNVYAESGKDSIAMVANPDMNILY
jgi:hypothetical protein